jgi:hypothetical protein
MKKLRFKRRAVHHGWADCYGRQWLRRREAMVSNNHSGRPIAAEPVAVVSLTPVMLGQLLAVGRQAILKDQNVPIADPRVAGMASRAVTLALFKKP